MCGSLQILVDQCLLSRDVFSELDQLAFLFFIGQKHGWRRNRFGIKVRIQTRFIDVVKEREKFVILFLRNRIVFMVVATGAFHCQTHERHPSGLHSVGNILDAELFVHAAALDLLGVQPIEGCRQNLIAGWVGKKVSSKLLGHKLVVT